MDNQLNKTISFVELLNIIRRRKWLVLLCLMGTLTPVLIYNFKAVPIYRASTKVIFEETERMMGFSPFGAINQGSFIANQIEEMKTKSFAQEVHAELPEQVRIKFRLLSSFLPEYDQEGFIVGHVKGNLSFTPVRGTEVINISYDSEDPELAKIVAGLTADVLTKRNLSVRRQKYSNVKSFIEQQFEIVEKRLEQAENAVKEYKESNNITSLETESKEILQRVTQAEVLYNQVGTNKKELQERLRVIQEKLDKEKKGLSKNILNTNTPLAAKLQERLVSLEVTYSNFQVQGYPKDNPKMVDLKKEIEQVKQNLVNETLKISDGRNSQSLVDPLSQITKFMEELISLDVELKALLAKEKNLKSLLSNYNSMLNSLPNKEMRLVRLLRDKEVNNKLYMTLLEEREKSRIKEASEIGSIRILEPARWPGAPISPRKLLNILVGIFSGLFLGIFLIFVLEYLDDTIRDQDDVEKVLGLPVIAVVPKLKIDLDKLFKGSPNGRTDIEEETNAILFDAYSLLSFALDQGKQRSSTIMVTSATPNEGKSTTAGMLALASAQRGKTTLLIDGDLRRPSLHTNFGVPREPGLTNFIVEFTQMVKKYEEQENGKFEQVPDSSEQENSQAQPIYAQMIRTSLRERIIQTFERNLLLLPCGFIPSNPVRIWSSAFWNTIIPQLKEIADIIIIDSPPVIGVAETTMMTRYIDHVLFCVSVGALDKKTLKRTFQQFKDSIENSDQKILGAVLNKADLQLIYGNYNYYGYYSKNQKSRLPAEVPKTDFHSA